MSLVVLLPATRATAQTDSVETEEIVKLKYFSDNNGAQYVVLDNFMKTGKRKAPLQNKIFELYLDSSSDANHIARVTTDKKGKAQRYLPPSLKASWDASSVHKFIAVADGKEEAATELEITKARIKIDTASKEGVRNITVTVMKYEKGEWQPANEVEMKVGIRRHGGMLSAGDEETYTSDSTGSVTVAFNKDSLPGDAKGNIILVSKVEDNDLFGNLMVEKTVPWGVSVKEDTHFFDQRTLWTTRFRAPFWLLFMAYSMVIGVWGVIVYLIIQIIKIKKLGKQVDEGEPV